MPISRKVGRWILYGLIFLSGSSGLVYEVVWHRYLAILLGAQARATAIVLAIFLGGISLGYACFGRWSRNKKWNLLLAYAIVEAGLAAWAFLFPSLFRLMLPLTAKLYSLMGVNNLLIDVAMSICLIGLPTFLMGGTLPLLTQGLSSDLTDASQTHARIYGFNTLGACLGCLLAGYVLIPMGGLSRAVYYAAQVNLLVAAAVYLLFARTARSGGAVSTELASPTKKPLDSTQKCLIAIGFLSGFYLISLQTVIIRLMGLSTGASGYNFTLIVAIFIFGLGIGSLLVRRISHFSFSHLFWNQLFVAFALLLLYLSGNDWPYWVHRVRITLRDIPQNFYFYQALLGILFSSVLIVPIGLSGLTLPLCFHLLKDDKETLGHRVGLLYGTNTLGCVLGALFGGYFLLNFIDLDTLFKLCVCLSLVAAGVAARLYFPKTVENVVSMAMAGVLAGLTIAGVLWAPRFAKNRFIQPFRHAEPMDTSFKGPEEWGNTLGRSTQFVFWKDDPNTSVGIGKTEYQGQELSRTIFINGKSDGNTRGDLFTTVMLAHIPALLAKSLDHVCVIGFGTGTTIGNLSQYPEAKRIDVAEISSSLIKNSRLFDKYNGGVSQIPKVHFNEMDAFRFLEGTSHSFDLIVSEPSNPWVAGIENLYSREFYEIAKRKMSPDGLFVQWIHTYSFNDYLFRMVLKTMGGRFPALSVFQLKGGDYALVGALKPFSRADLERAARRYRENSVAHTTLQEAGVTRFETILALEVIPSSLVPIMSEGAEEHTLESPKLSNEAAKAFFVGSAAKVDSLRREWKEYYTSMDQSLLATYRGNQRTTGEMAEGYRTTFCESSVSKNSKLCEEALAVTKFLNPTFQPSPSYEDKLPARDLASLEGFERKPPKKFSADDLQQLYLMYETYKKYFSPVAFLPISLLLERADLCMEATPKEESLFGECLLQKILMLESRVDLGTEWSKSANDFLDWFPTLRPNSPNYSKLEEARDILVKMQAEVK